MKTFGGNSGYMGYKMSKRAAAARLDGVYPKTDLKKEYKVTASHFEFLKSADIIYVSEWHHTSKYGNETYFYRWADDEYPGIYANHKKIISKLIKELGKGKAPRMNDYAIEEMVQFSKAHSLYVARKTAVISQIQDIFYQLTDN